jgi:hypothetical protein
LPNIEADKLSFEKSFLFSFMRRLCVCVSFGKKQLGSNNWGQININLVKDQINVDLTPIVLLSPEREKT